MGDDDAGGTVAPVAAVLARENPVFLLGAAPYPVPSSPSSSSPPAKCARGGAAPPAPLAEWPPVFGRAEGGGAAPPPADGEWAVVAPGARDEPPVFGRGIPEGDAGEPTGIAVRSRPELGPAEPRLGGGLGLLIVLAQLGMCRSAAVWLNRLPQ